jgi:hypothetical protein
MIAQLTAGLLIILQNRQENVKWTHRWETWWQK